MCDIYYFRFVNNPFDIQSTLIIEEFINYLYTGEADFISAAQLLELSLDEKYLDCIKRSISEYEERIPLYDISFNHIYLINKDNVYPKIHFDNYRFIEDKFYSDLIAQAQSNLTANDRENARILSHYDIKILAKTYLKIFYESYVINSFITSCQRPSYFSGMDHISPYYSINELYYLAYDWNLIKGQNHKLDNKQINKLCGQISRFDIPAEILLAHQMHIYDSKGIGLVKYYSLYGSYYINLYLRKYNCYMAPIKNCNRNIVLETQIGIMMALVQSAPAFTKSHTVYRFIERDDFMAHLKPGDIYQDSSFMSTTRNPFYYKENYAFGYILIKIKLPKGVKGIGLCIEAYSNFPKEEEIILPPTSKFRLVAVSDTSETSEFHTIFNLKVTKRYEFVLEGNDAGAGVGIDMVGALCTMPDIPVVDLARMIDDVNIQYLNMADRLEYFKKQYLNVNNQFSSLIDGDNYIFNVESYDSSSVYKEFFYYETSTGIMITTSNPTYGNINAILEIGNEIHVNYYFKFSVTDQSSIINLNNGSWILWLSLLAYVVGSKEVVIHPNYSLTYNKADSIDEKKNKTRYTFPQNIYAYMKYKKRYFEFQEITANFDYYQLQYLFSVPVTEYIASSDHSELYRTHRSNSTIDNMGDFYIYIVEHNPKLIKQLQDKIDEIYDSTGNESNNPFKNMSYKLDPWLFLYNKKYISYIPSSKDFIKRGSFKKLIGNKKIFQFKNRLREFLLKH